MSRFVVVTHSCGETAFLRIVAGRSGVRYGLARAAGDATTFRDRIAAGTAAGRAGTIILRLFSAVEAVEFSQQ